MLGAGALLGAVLGGAGVVGLALGFAMKDTIENYVSSLMLSLRQPFRANDKVKIDDYEGRVVRLTTRATILMTDDGNHLRLPNSKVFKAVIVNYTRNPQRRFEFILQIDTKADPDQGAPLRLSRAEGARFRARETGALGGGQGHALSQYRDRVRRLARPDQDRFRQGPQPGDRSGQARAGGQWAGHPGPDHPRADGNGRGPAAAATRPSLRRCTPKAPRRTTSARNTR